MGWQTGIVGAWLCIKRHFHRPYACLPSTKATKVSGAGWVMDWRASSIAHKESINRMLYHVPDS